MSLDHPSNRRSYLRLHLKPLSNKSQLLSSLSYISHLFGKFLLSGKWSYGAVYVSGLLSAHLAQLVECKALNLVAVARWVIHFQFYPFNMIWKPIRVKARCNFKTQPTQYSLSLSDHFCFILSLLIFFVPSSVYSIVLCNFRTISICILFKLC